MKAILPVFCRPLGYVMLAVALFGFLLLAMFGVMNDNNIVMFKECTKVLMISGALMILLALNKAESPQIGQIRIKATRRAVFLTLIFLFINMLYRVASQDMYEVITIKESNTVESTSFLIFMIINVLCLEFGITKTRIDALFKR